MTINNSVICHCFLFLQNHTTMMMSNVNVHCRFFKSAKPHQNCRNPSFGLATKAKGLQGCGLRGSPGAKAKRLQGCGPKGSPKVTSHTLGNARKCEGVNTHIPKATPTLGYGVPVNSRNFRERFQGSKLNGLWRSLYHWKALET